MKTTFFLIIGFLLLFASGSISSQEVTGKNTDLQTGSVSTMCTPDLYELTSKWASEFGSLHPEVKINVSEADYGSTGFGTGGSLGFISGKATTAIIDETNWKMVVGRDVVVAVMNSENPFSAEVNKQGISQEQLTQMLINPLNRNWGTMLVKSLAEPIHLYIVNDETVKAGLEKFINGKNIAFTGIIVGTRDEMVSAIQKDPYAIGFCSLLNITESDQNLAGNLKLLPIDKNGNGTLEYMENIYADLNTFQRGIWIGKYPKSLVSNVYAVSNVQPANENELEFLKWVITEGQLYMNANGYCELVGSESQSQLDKLTIASINVSPVKDASQAGIVLLIVALVLVAGWVTSAVVRNYRKQKNITPDFNISPTGFSEDTLVLPNGLYFDKSHTWSFMEKDGNITVGIDDFLQHITGPVSRIEMKSPGETIRKGDVLFSIIQFGKQLNIYAPFSGIIKKQNTALLSDSSAINSSPYEAGWVYRIEPSNWIKEVQLMDLSEKYRRWLGAEFTRLKEFMTAILRPESPEYAHIVLQDGGELKEGVLAEFGPKVWEDFQTNFLDTFK